MPSHSRDVGARPTVSLPVGQIADYAIDTLDGAPSMVREFDTHFEAVVAGVRLAIEAAEVAEQDPSTAMYVGGALLGGSAGSAISNKSDGALPGAGLGLLFAALVDSSMDDQKRRRR